MKAVPSANTASLSERLNSSGAEAEHDLARTKLAHLSQLGAKTRSASLQSPPFSGRAIAGFLFSVLWLGGLGSIVGLAMSVEVMKETSSGRRAGHGLAVAALIISILVLLPGILIFISILHVRQQQADELASISREPNSLDRRRHLGSRRS
jgi:Mn2+/Fe2+ NRAMP family transporter